jgi:hypothetical protein
MSSGLSGMTGLGGLIGASGSIDPDAQAFLSVTGIANSQIVSAIDRLVRSLKTRNLWDRMLAIYPMVGGTTNTHKYNLKNSSFAILNIASGAISDAGGIRTPTDGSVSNAATTSEINFSNVNHINYCISTYWKNPGFTIQNGFEDFAISDSGKFFLGYYRHSNGRSYVSSGSWGAYADSDATGRCGFFATRAISSSQAQLWYRSSNFSNPFSHLGLPSLTGSIVRLGNNALSPSSWFSIGASYNDSEMVTLESIVHEFQTALGRNAAY